MGGPFYGPGPERGGGFLEHGEGVGPPDPEAIDARAPRRASVCLGPGSHRRRDIEGRLGKPNFRVRRLQVERRWDYAMFEDQRRLDEARQAGRLLGVPNVGLGRTDRTESHPFGVRAKRLGQGADLEGIADDRSGSVALDVAHAIGAHLRDLERLDHRAGLAQDARRRVARLAAAVVVDGRSANDCVDVIAVGDGGGQRFQQHGRHPATEDGPRSRSVERATVAVRRVDAVLLGDVPAQVRHADRGGAGQRHVTFAGQQALASQVNCHEGGRTRGLNREARTGEVELVGNARRKKVLVVAYVRQASGLPRHLRMARVGGQIARDDSPCASKHPDDLVVLLWIVPGVLERLPSNFEQEALCWIQQSRLSRGVPEEGGIEVTSSFDHGRRTHVPGVGDVGGGGARGQQLGRREETDRLDACAEVSPEFGGIVGAGKATGHPDDSYSVESLPGLPGRPRSASRFFARLDAAVMSSLRSSIAFLPSWPGMLVSNARHRSPTVRRSVA